MKHDVLRGRVLCDLIDGLERALVVLEEAESLDDTIKWRQRVSNVAIDICDAAAYLRELREGGQS